MSSPFSSLLGLLLWCSCLQITIAQDILSANNEDTSAIIAASWKNIEAHYPNRDTLRIQQLLTKHQTLAHQYGFRFDQQFNTHRLNFAYHQLFDELFILEDPTNNLTVEAIRQQKYQDQFVPNYSETTIQRDILQFFPIPTAYNVRNNHWVKLNAVNLSNQETEAWMMIGWNERSWDKIEVYQDDGTKVKKIGQSGLRVALSDKMAKEWRNFVRITVPPNTKYTYYFKLAGVYFPKYPDRIAFYHFDEVAYWHQKSFSLFGDGAFLGITGLLFLIVVTFYYYDQERYILFFAIQLAGIWLHDFADTENMGSSNFYNELFTGALDGGHILAILGFLLLGYGGVQFPLAFLDADRYAPILKKWFLRTLFFALGTYMLLGIFNLFLYPYFDYPYYWILYLIYFCLLILTFLPLLLLVLGATAWYKKHPLAKIFSLAYLPLIISHFVGFGSEAFLNVSTSSNLFQTSTRIGFLGTYFLFTAAIFYKRQIERKEILEKRLALKVRLEQEQQEAQRLKELDSFKTRLYTNLTHEFRTPLTVILGITKKLEQLPKNDLGQSVKIIERNGENLLRLINQLLDLSKLENNSFQLNLQQSDIITFLKYITESFQSYANTQNLSLQFHTTLERLEMDFAPPQTTQIMTNLLSNALKFTPSEGAVKILVSADEEYLLIKITDTGAGISTEKLPYIFDRFYQVDNSSTRQVEGTGIGLAHTKEMIKLMDGSIKVESTLGMGTTFLVRLKITKEAPVVAIKELYSDRIKSENKQVIRDKTIVSQIVKNSDSLPQILIIEDNPDIVFYLKSCLSQQYKLTTAFNGKIGIEKALATIPDIIISDVMMPDKDGYEVCATLKKDSRTSHIPIILLTARADADSRNKGFSKGADAYLIKPFNQEELMIRLDQMIQKKDRMLAFFSTNSKGTNHQNGQLKENETAILVEDVFIKKVRKIVNTYYKDENFGLPQLCQKVGMSRSQLFRKMKALLNVSPSKFIRDYRLQQAKLLLESGEWNVSEVTYRVGLKDISHFSRIFQETFGYPPSSTKKINRL